MIIEVRGYHGLLISMSKNALAYFDGVAIPQTIRYDLEILLIYGSNSKDKIELRAVAPDEISVAVDDGLRSLSED